MGESGRVGRSIVQNPAPWQRCIHGGESMLREEVFEQLLAVGGEKSAFRYAACGLADSVTGDGVGAKVAPMGCGHRLCPRCSRQRGRPMIRRIFAWLAAEAHQDIFTMCLTQPVKAGESLVKARARMRRKEADYLQTLKERGLVSGCSCTHIVWSQACGGWHYHVHLLLELPTGEWSPEALRELYAEIGASEQVQAGADSSRLVVGAGPADPALVEGGGDPDFWSDSAGGLAASVQYPVRDMAQGIGGTRCGGDRERVRECVAVLLKHAKGWKLRRTFGKWRKPAPAVPLPEGELDALAEAKASPAPSIMETRFGTVHRLSRQAVAGDQFAAGLFRMLEVSIRNNTEFAKRFVAFCRAASTLDRCKDT